MPSSPLPSPSSDRGASSAARRAVIPAVTFLVFVSLLRSPITAIPPLLGRMGADLGMSAGQMGALTSIPVFCFGVLTPVASVVLRRLEVNVAALWTLGIIIVGALVRSSGSVWAAFGGTAVIAAGMTMGNLIAPMVIARDFRSRTALMTASYSASINVAVTLSTALAVPLALVIGWQGSSAAWALVPGIVAAVIWWKVFPPHGRGSEAALVAERRSRNTVAERRSRNTVAERRSRNTVAERRSRRSGVRASGVRIASWPLAWIMAAAFAGHNFSYYSVVAWLPTALRETAGMGESGAGVASSVFQITAVIGPLMVPVMMNRLGWPMTRIIGVICCAWLALPFGMLVAPGVWFVWCVLGGMAQGAFFSALFTVVIQRTATPDENRRLTALIQTTGYIVAALGPVLVGQVHAAVGGWSLPFGIIGTGTVIMTICAVIAVRDRSTPPGREKSARSAAGTSTP
ncbi:MFS transporter [Acidipropionibacterium acidipropionici]|uniref:ABC transporter n=1 Tax=Acidipropionibacterium acidipropionici TaxID=1748 RepID=A0AAC8YF94_9ACTN|nr:MFS transporter [Acidipropionibacterium acidipropionici]AMS05400.1 ABC transporter [Acidipropionibacterium acidipropionici]AOZ46874.1 ABC transporter [Acidipropionibacterium acidipropionici]AZP37044.1 MFS transporter [Acidipropionibacterium acidipropionici]